ncbi:MAG TPA: hypothetical protein VGE62_01555 [Candidatus Paceibacterota bacterium]
MKLFLVIIMNVLAVAPIVYLAMSPEAISTLFSVSTASVIPEAVRRALLLAIPAVLAVILSFSVRKRSVSIALVGWAVVAGAFLFL